jgi:hypothetical protein
MQQKNKYKIAFIIVIACFVTSCKKYLDVNTDPSNPTSIAAHARLVGAITTTNGSSMWRGAREIAGVTQYGVTKLLTGTNRNAETWRFTSGYFFWQNAYVFTMPNCVDLIVLGKQENNLHFAGVGEILFALNLGMLADQYGSIVASDYYDGVSQIKLQPRMDDQQTVYHTIDSLLDDAIVNLKGNNTIPLNYSNGDIIFKGVVDKWIRFAWSLKARYLNHLSKKGSLYNAAKIIEACKNGFNADGMDAEFPYIAGQQATDENPWASWGGFTDPANPRYFTWSQFFVNMLTQFPVTETPFQDPRISRIMKPATSDNVYRGLRSGAGLAGGQDGTGVKTAETDYGPFSKSGFYTNTTSPFPFITYSEVKLIQAEASLRSGDKAGALAAYEEGVKANMRKLGVSAADINTYWAAQLTDGLIAHFDDLTRGLSHIMRQKYITQCLNPETWVDMRRMDYSKSIYGNSLRRPVNLNSIIFDPNNDSQWIRAMVYESNEQNRNPEAVGDNSEKYRLLTPLWWDTP